MGWFCGFKKVVRDGFQWQRKCHVLAFTEAQGKFQGSERMLRGTRRQTLPGVVVLAPEG